MLLRSFVLVFHWPEHGLHSPCPAAKESLRYVNIPHGVAMSQLNLWDFYDHQREKEHGHWLNM
jgi:hypothetical protein